MRKKSKLVIYPELKKKLEQMGMQIKLARLRRKLPVKLVSERAGVSQTTVWAIEKGTPSVSMGAYASVLNAIQMADELLLIAANDKLGQMLQDKGLKTRKRAPKESGDTV